MPHAPQMFDAPDPMQPLIDENGRINAEWYKWFLLIAHELNELKSAVEELQGG